MSEITRRVQNCPEVVIKRELVAAAQEFCASTGVVQRTMLLDVASLVPDYALTPLAGLQLCEVLYVSYGATKLRAVAVDSVASPVALRGAVDTAEPQVGTPSYFYQTSPYDLTLHLWPHPENSLVAGLFVKASYMPTNTATELPDELLTYHLSDIANGTIARLKTIPEQPFTDLAGASGYAAAFQAAKVRERREARVGKVRTAQRVNPRFF